MFSGIMGGLSPKVAHVPDYMKNPEKKIGYGIEYWLKQQDPTNDIQDEGLEGIIRQAREGTGVADASQAAYQNIMGGGGLNTQQQQLAQQLTGGQLVNPATGTINDIAAGNQVGRNPYLDATYNRAASAAGQQFRDAVVPGMDNAFAASGRLGSNAYAQQRNKAENALSGQMNDLANQVYGGAYNTDRSMQMQALGQQAQLGQQDVQNRLAGAGLYGQGAQQQLAGLGLGQQVQNLSYDDLSRLYQAGTQKQNAYFDQYAQAANILGTLKGNPVVPGGPSAGAQLAGLGINAAAAAAMAFSDRRLKRGVTRIGETPRGLPVYRYSYVWDPPEVWRVGVMADEAAMLFPDAVTATPSGFLAVDYARIA